MPVSGGLYKKDSPICMWKHQELRRKEKDCTALVRCEDLSTFYGPRKTRDTRLVPKANCNGVRAAKAASLSLQFTTELGALQGLLVGTFGY